MSTHKNIQHPTKMQAYTPPYTAAEKRWLEVHYGGEFHFLRCYSLSIYDEGDREEGRIIARSLMEEDNGSYY